MSLWTKGSFFYEIKFKNKIFHVRYLFIILIHNIFNNPYLSL